MFPVDYIYIYIVYIRISITKPLHHNILNDFVSLSLIFVVLLILERDEESPLS